MTKTTTQLKTLAATAILAFAAPITAAEEGDPTGFYAGVGAALMQLDCPAGFTCDDSDTSPVIYIGGMFNENFGLELGYVSNAEFKIQGGGIEGDLEYSSLYLGLIGRGQLNDNFAIFGKIGANTHNSDINVTARSGSNTASVTGFDYDTSAFFGAGLELSSGDLAGRLGYTLLHSDVGYGELSILYRLR
ncbi:MAG: outer membrane beta-barrel protein [Gammaproteobacteria bacterium]